MTQNTSGIYNRFIKQISFSILINLTKTKNNRYVVLKPMISIVDNDKKMVELVLKKVGIVAPIKKRDFLTYSNYQVRIQDFEQIRTILSNVNMLKNLRQKDIKNIALFNKIFTDIETIGYIHKKWDPHFIKILLMKDELNNNKNNSRGFTKAQWIKKIKEHFIS